MVESEKFKTNLREVIGKAKEITSHLHIISILPVASAIDGITVPSGKQRSNQIIEEYNQVLQEFAAQYGIAFINLYHSFLKKKIFFYRTMVFTRMIKVINLLQSI